jgi:hypothetical protein
MQLDWRMVHALPGWQQRGEEYMRSLFGMYHNRVKPVQAEHQVFAKDV